MIHTAFRAVIAALALGLLSGCGRGGGEEKVVASAGDIQVTLADFHEAYNKITPNYRPDISTLEAKRNFANDLVNKEILLAEGRRMGGITDSLLLAQLDGAKRNKMLEILYREQIESQVEVRGRDVADLYEKRKANVRASHILVDDVETARKIRQEILSGKISFEEAARKYSLDQSTKTKGGLIGEIAWSQASPSYQRKVFELEPGVLSEPVETEFGVHLLRAEERIPQELPTLEEMRAGLRTDARRQLEAVRMREYVAELEAKAGLTWNDDGLRVLLNLIEEESKLDIDTIPAAEQHVPAATEQQRQQVLATYSGKQLTIGDYIDFVASQPVGARPVTRLPLNGIKELIRTRMLQQELLVQEAYALGLDKREEVMDADARIREQALVEIVHARFIQAADVPDEDVRAFYDSTLAADSDAFMIPERVDIAILVHAKEDAVRKGLQRLRAGEPEDQVIRELSLDLRTKYKGGRTGLMARGNYAPQVEDVAFSRSAGSGWSDPIVTESGVAAVKVYAHEQPRRASFDEVKDTITTNLARARGEEAFEEWLQEQRKKRGVVIHDDVLELIGKSVS